MQEIIYGILNERRAKNIHREFNEIIKNPDNCSTVFINKKEVTNFCSNDYLRLSMNKEVIKSMVEATAQYGVGSGGTRNISGTNKPHNELEAAIAKLHDKPKAVVFSSAYMANVGCLYALGKYLPNVIFFSDEQNHSSIIHGMKYSGAKKVIYQHGNLNNLELLLSRYCTGGVLPVIACESVYSMSGFVTNLLQLEKIAKQYNAITYVDEVHSVGIYGNGKGLIAECNANIDIINGTLGKAFGTFGGYIASSENIIEFIKSFATTFIFSTSLPPCICVASQKAIEIATNNASLLKQFWLNVSHTKYTLENLGIGIVQTKSHIISIPIGSETRVKAISKTLLDDFGIYVQPIFYPTVELGKAIIRITVSPFHTFSQIEKLSALKALLLNEKSL